MPKRTIKWTEEKIARFYGEGRGSGELANYKPWLTIQDVRSSGRAHRLQGWKTNREHHLRSDLERDYFYLLDWTDSVIDIREQYPLDREKTLQIAEKKQVNHSTDPTTKTPIVFTTDFFITIRRSNTIHYIARTTQPSAKLNDKRVIEKFEIERQYWADAGVDWGIVTELDFPKETSDNIAWVHRSYYLEENEMNLAVVLYDFLENSSMTILKACNSFDEQYSCEQGTALSLLKYLIARKYVQIQMDKPVNLRYPTSELFFLLSREQKERLAT